jgi:hypothetical protein
MDKKALLKKIGLALGTVLLLLVLSYATVPQVLQGRIVNQSDISGYVGMSHEMSEWNKAHPDDPARWTDAMFGGMPTTSISAPTRGDWTQKMYGFLLLGRRPATYLFVTLLGAFLLMLSLGINWLVAICGAIAAAFCSYNFQIIQVGHNTKMQAIAFLPWVLAALVYTYRKAIQGRSEATIARRLPGMLIGAALFGLALSMQIKANHQQITYYLAFMVLIYALVVFIHVVARQKEAIGRFFVASALLLVLGGAGIATNVNKLLPLYKYTPHTMRGGSELSGENGKKTGGLDLEYATAWSYGWEELPNLMIPNFNGGSSSGAVNPEKSATIKLLRKAGQGNLRETAKHLPMYWGPQPFTAGPMYMGAVTVFLFVLGLCLYRGKEKWWLLAATILAVLMALGNHFMGFTKLCFKVLPMYNKFRSVSMALVVLQYTLPMQGFLVLDRILKEEYSRKDLMKGALVALGVTGGFSLLSLLFPGIAGSFTGAVDSGQQDILVDAFIADRKMLFRHDAAMALILVSVTFLLIWWSASPKGQTAHAKAFAGFGRRYMAVGAIGIIVLVDMLAVGRRYLGPDDFVLPKKFDSQFTERTVDKLIKEDTDPSYRVLDLTVNVFNDSHPSYHHKNVGGYSPAKLQRYQDLIDRYLTGEINSLYRAAGKIRTIGDFEAALPPTPVLNALNTRYIILGAENPPAENPDAFGPAWFVDSVAVAASPEEEITKVGLVDLRHQAVATAAVDAAPGSSEDIIELVSYTPNQLEYSYSASSDRVAVFSEIYYPDGWKAWLDGDSGKSVEVFCADWTLRGAVLPEGEHTLTMRFEPASYKIGERVSRASSILLLLVVIASACLAAESKRIGTGRPVPRSGGPDGRKA